LARRFDQAEINRALDVRVFGPEPEVADQLGVSVPTLRRIRRGQPVHPAIALRVLQWIESHPPAASADRLLAGVS